MVDMFKMFGCCCCCVYLVTAAAAAAVVAAVAAAVAAVAVQKTLKHAVQHEAGAHESVDGRSVNPNPAPLFLHSAAP